MLWPTVLSVDQHLGALIAGDVSGCRNGFALRRVNGSGAFVASTFDRPAFFMRDNMLIFMAHFVTFRVRIR